jgi:hypothetical protein
MYQIKFFGAVEFSVYLAVFAHFSVLDNKDMGI